MIPPRSPQSTAKKCRRRRLHNIAEAHTVWCEPQHLQDHFGNPFSLSRGSPDQASSGATTTGAPKNTVRLNLIDETRFVIETLVNVRHVTSIKYSSCGISVEAVARSPEFDVRDALQCFKASDCTEYLKLWAPPKGPDGDETLSQRGTSVSEKSCRGRPRSADMDTRRTATSASWNRSPAALET